MWQRFRSLLARWLPGETQRLYALTLVIGATCGFVAVGFHLTIRAVEHLLIDRALPSPVWTIVTATLGSLLVGMGISFIWPAARGSGIPQVKASYALEHGRLRLRDAVGKFIVTPLQIGTGASAGREGPTAYVCAAVASLIGRWAGLPPRSIKRLIPVGMAAGIAAAFNAPIAAVTFTIEEIVGSLDQNVLSGAVIAAAMAAVIERSILGTHPVITVPQGYGLDHPASLLIYGLLGVVAGFVSIAFTDSLLAVKAGFKRLRGVPGWAQPALGGLATGVLAVVMIRSMGTNGITGAGYEVMGEALAGKLGLALLAVLFLAKFLATVLTYSSGGPGGIFAPTLFMGAMLGGLFGIIDMHALGHGGGQLGPFALVGMGAFFAGVIRAPITSVLIIFEMTGSYGLVLPLMLANMTAFALARHWRPRQIYDAFLAQEGIHLPEHHAVPPSQLERIRVSAAMTSAVATVAAEQRVAEIADADFSTYPVVAADGQVQGLVPMALLRAERAAGQGQRVAGELATRAVTIEAADTLGEAAVLMNDSNVRQLVVLDDRGKLAGILTMSDLVRAVAREA